MIEKKEKYANDINLLRYNGGVERAFYDGKEVMRMIYDGEVVFNRAKFYLEAETEINLTAAGTRGAPLYDVIDPVSFKTYFDGSRLEAEFSGADDVIEPNNTEEELSGIFTIRQKFSDLEITGTWIQEGNRVIDVEFQYISSVSVRYEDNLPAYASVISPRVSVTYAVKETYAGNETGTKYYTTSGDVGYAKGEPLNSSGATISSTTGDVYSKSLGKTPAPEQEAFVVNEMSGTVSIYIGEETVNEDWEWTGNLFVYQNSNSKYNNGNPYYNISSTVSTNRVGKEESTVTLYVSAWSVQPVIWSSLEEDSEYLSTYVNISVPSYCMLSSSIVYGDADVTITIPQNGETERTIPINVSNDSAGYNVTHHVTQDAFVDVEYWAYPELDGSLPSIVIPASGSGVAVLVPITQNHYKNGEVIETYTAIVNATAVTGSPVGGTGASFSGGLISASSMGTTSYPSGRAVYYLATVTVTGKDGKSYNLTLPSPVEVRQAENIQTTEYGGYVLSVSANPSSGIAYAGGTSTITASAQIQRIYTWSSGADGGTELSDSNAWLKTTHGSISPTEIWGTNQTATLTLGENGSTSVKTTTVTLYVGNASKTCTVKQNAASYSFTRVSSQNISIAAGASVVTISVNSLKNGKALPIPAANVLLSGIAGAEVKNVVQSTYPVGQSNIVISVGTNSGVERQLAVSVKQPETGTILSFTVTQAKSESQVPSGMNVLAQDARWYLGTVFTGQYAGSGSNQKGVYTLLVATTDSNYAESKFRYNLSYTTINVSTGSTTSATVLDTTKIIPVGQTVTINGTTYYGVTLASGPALSVTVTSFELL